MMIKHQVFLFDIEYKKKGFRSEKEYLEAKIEDDYEDQSENIEDFEDINIEEEEVSQEDNIEEDEEMEIDE